MSTYLTIQLRPDQVEHRKIAWAEGQTVKLVRELKPDLWVTDLRVPTPAGNSDYEHDGFLVVMPSKDGWVSRPDAPTFDALYRDWPRAAGQENLSFRMIVNRVHAKLDPLRMDPDYQRDHVWTDEQSGKFIGFLMEGGDAPAIWVQRWECASGKPDELLDGRQRITAVLKFMNNEIPMILSDERSVFLREFSTQDQKFMTGVSGPNLIWKYTSFKSRVDVLRMYLRLNRGGTVHTDQEIEKVRLMLAKEIR